ncbi:hydroxymethylglutaryl-CoA lyase [Alicyclobacillus cycloheptanicus]|uniref:Hydroxymethylglutaryl-CoA lyase n=1 Tax=Alicyclobacillus cycloheptanicus TaxID=1457 RepID=A0ABT9XH65_9BACL|nr:hydroxymethylglutaryl-CoA lyase [Alicyclobacillus cycloheptanicus]MDQ0189379.1 hydroxymethylglutaryl-CoA lyase [Alicyclobacillus cycloheptanicus]WDM02255.1 hydroxymethylglutaryl-CoA lyase [Alicyclobacillus cycloheptanicus]
MKWPQSVRIVDVTPRDGLQDADGALTSEQKIRLCKALYDAGVRSVEITAFVSPKWVPLMKDAETVATALRDCHETIALVPNEKGFDRALATGVDAVTFVVSASPMHQQENLRMPLADSLQQFRRIAERNDTGGSAAGADVGRVRLRGAISCAFGSPFSDETIVPAHVADIAEQLVETGAVELGLADTVGVGTPQVVYETLCRVKARVGEGVPIVLHLHDRYELGLGNITAALMAGVTTFETALGGLGGCPFVPDAPGNLDTEKVVCWMHRMGIETGIDEEGLAQTRTWLLDALRASVARA